MIIIVKSLSDKGDEVVCRGLERKGLGPFGPIPSIPTTLGGFKERHGTNHILFRAGIVKKE